MDEAVNQEKLEELSFLFEETRNFQSIARNGF